MKKFRDELRMTVSYVFFFCYLYLIYFHCSFFICLIFTSFDLIYLSFIFSKYTNLYFITSQLTFLQWHDTN